MKGFVITLALAALAAAPVNAQIVSSSRIPSSSSRNIDGTWRSVGRDASGHVIYERTIRDNNGNIVLQRGVRDGNGTIRVTSSRNVGNDNNGTYNGDCRYNRTTNNIGDIIFGRANDNNANCEDNGSRIDGGWYQVGRGRDNNSIYERRTRDSNGNLVIQRARRNSNGTFTILSTRVANDNDRQWRKAEKEREKAQKRQEREYRKDQKEAEKEYRKANHDDHGRGKHKGDR